MPISKNSWKEVCKEQDVLPPKRRPDWKTRFEMYVGRQMVFMRNCNMPPQDKHAFLEWIDGFIPEPERKK